MSKDENKNQSPQTEKGNKNIGNNPATEKYSKIGESKAQQDIIRKGAEIPPKTPTKK